MRIALRLEYEGTEFHGSQLQANLRTVQGEVERALERLFQRRIRPHLASRTDAGVHAKDQVAAFNVETELEMDTIRNALNYHLPADVAVKLASRVSESFLPRQHARAREYLYIVSDAPARSPIHRRFEASTRGPLDEAAMGEAARMLKGTRDFAAFAGPATPEGACTTRRMHEVDITRKGHRILISFRANAFLHQQVRRMTAALVGVGRQASDIEGFRRLVEGAERGSAQRIMPAQGLCLTRIEYAHSGPGALPAAA